MTRGRKYMAIGAGAAAILAIVLSVFVSGKRDGSSTPGPEETVEAFCKALTAGDFSAAANYCRMPEMDEYIGRLSSAWEASDSAAAAIVPAILSETAVRITDLVKDGQDRTVFYELTAADGAKKEKIAVLTSEEGKWKIKEITDRQ